LRVRHTGIARGPHEGGIEGGDVDLIEHDRGRRAVAGALSVLLVVLTAVGVIPFVGLALAVAVLVAFAASPGAVESPGFLLSAAVVTVLVLSWAAALRPGVYGWLVVAVLAGGLALDASWRRSPGFLALSASLVMVMLGATLDITPVFVFLAVLAIALVASARSSGRYVYRRVLALIPIVLAVSFFSFSLLSFLPGDVAVNIAGPGATPEYVEQLRADLHLDDPLPVRYLHWLSDAAKGDLSTSPFSREDITDGLARTLPVSMQLMLYAVLLATAVSIPLGVLAAYRAGTRLDRALSTSMFGLLALPNFVIALILILFFAVGKSVIGLDWFPATVPTNTRIGFGENTVLHLKQVLLPVVALAAGLTATYMRLLRTDMVATLQEDYISVAKAKGLSTWRILFGHALRPSSFTLLTVLGINIAALISGSLIIEVIFVLPGVGTYLATAIFQRDYLVIQGVVVVLALAFVLANLAVDLLYALLDPRIRDARTVL
jgi:peptide/nickel transport system permease protein